MSTLIGVDELEVAHMAHHRKRVGYTVSAMHITRLSCDTESFSRTVALYDGNHFRRRAALVQQPPDPKASLEPKRDLDLHIDQLLLVELRVGKRTDRKSTRLNSSH